ncbi:hypothetical protein M1K46_10445 [Fictibacillus sp. WQ 8-8]|uniref:hypothetical protein n=1 Tax=unclassified Fictibacillus TaxID=2644029 RepID=UPI00078161FD|nr:MULTISPECIES: hypothetical protein [unclassified Fictibacillus]MCQ6266082.1 hypothetical protein [Fictibacillus sp. WQ 8-8]SFD72259.1 hypothetical protein SAMN05428981_1011597 [Bacillus sp. OV194]
MKIRACTGYELEKEKPNSPEDFFNRSEVFYEQEGQEKSFQLLYVRYFEEQLLPRISEQLITDDGEQLAIKDIAALVCLLHLKDALERRRLYMNREENFLSLFQNVDWSDVKKIWKTVKQQ